MINLDFLFAKAITEPLDAVILIQFVLINNFQ